MQPRTSVLDQDFDELLVAELESLRIGEQRLERLYSRLCVEPRLRDYFLQELAEFRQRADRLDAVLNPLEAFQSPAKDVHSTVIPAA